MVHFDVMDDTVTAGNALLLGRCNTVLDFGYISGAVLAPS